VVRRYRQLLLADARPLTVFEDCVTGNWYTQRYPVQAVEIEHWPS